LLDLSRILPKEKIKIFEKEFQNADLHSSLNDWKSALPKEFEFNEIRLLLNHYMRESNEETD